MHTVVNIPSVLFLIGFITSAFFLPKKARNIAFIAFLVGYVICVILVQQGILHVSVVTGPGME